MPTSLAGHFAQIEAALAEAAAFPLSRRKALLVAVLLDNFADRAFDAWREAPDRVFGAEDVLAFRDGLSRACPALGRIADICGPNTDGPRLAIQPVAVPLADYPGLGVEDFMVSLYNGHTVQRVVIAGADGGAQLALDVFGQAVAWWRARGLD